MKSILAAVFGIMVLTGCTYTNNYETGTKISSENVNKIVKGKTTEAELIAMFGQPFSKSVISENEMKWIYAHNSVSASAQAFTMKTTSSSEMTTLDILLKDGVVVNYAFTKTPINPTSSMSTSI